MACRLTIRLIVIIAVANVALSLVEKLENKTTEQKMQTVQARRQRLKTKKPASTSSSGSRQYSGELSAESMDLTESGDASDLFAIKKDSFTDAEKHGWKKYHRECHICTEDMIKKWRDPSIQWICGAYQRARRTFKSACMMYYRNCQDGTMFVEIHKGKCKDDLPGDPRPHGDHFFYEYRVVLTEESGTSLSSVEPDDTY
ncbi:uncharacterized protein LOC106710369 [Papilio machaon]|uniref:uncharacterized protein LOC106710369 n=1 Tax=Papilio machaon TaxID=76193 RepID=UPI001E665937|nr:uncharacterized protein LOC106710369 [Papilio machaon]